MLVRDRIPASGPVAQTLFRVLALAGLLAAPGPLFAQCVPVGQPCPPPGGLRPGFGPLVLAGGGTMRGGAPAVADLGLTPGHKSIVFGTSNGRLYVVRHDGTVAPGFPVTLPREIVSSPAIGTLTKPDGTKVTAIVVGYGSNFAGQVDAGGIRAYLPNGTLLWEKLSGAYVGATAPVVSAPAIGDLDGDGRNEVVWTSFDEHVHVSDGGTGAEKAGWPYRTYDTIWSSPALHDVDGDGRLEVVVGSDQHLEPAPIGTPNGGGLYVLRADGQPLAGFPKFLDQVVSSSPAVGDVDGDGKPEIVVGTGGFWAGAAHALYAFECTGATVPGWPVTVQGQVVTSPALADLTGDGVPEVVATDDSSSPDGLRRLYAFRGNGTSLFPALVIRDYFGANLSAGDPVVGDVLGTASPEILVPTNGEICVVSSGGVQLTDDGGHASGKFSFMVATSLANATVAELDSDGAAIEVIAIAGAASAGDLGVWVWNPKAPTLPIPWGSFHRDAARDGTVPGTPTCASSSRLRTLAPCRVLDTRGATPGALAGGAFAGGETRSYALAGRCGVPATARAVALNLTVVSPGASGGLVAFPGDQAAIPVASSLAYKPGVTRANNAVVRLSTDGTATLKLSNVSAGGTHVLFDVSGYFE